ncbi:carboxylate--amine ligase [Nocardioides cynanchi]|uniref:carboxylate--amine ligase n=1 Tax=Nocardioides cynanchi TaxID=2558918 RepID=UPI0017843B3A|nr:carboxylate--amine ligase [Nocardioides cynanchi]
MKKPDSRRRPWGDGPAAVVVGLDNITGLQTARILADRGVRVYGVASDRRHFGARTNACVEVVESRLSGPALVDTLRRLARRLGPDRAVLVPCTDGAVWALSLHRDELLDLFRLPLGDHDGIDLLMDKVRFADHAHLHGLAAPRTEVLRSRADAEKAAEVLTWPSLLKPPVKAEEWLAHTSAKGIPVRSPEELLDVYDRVAGWAPVLLAQEWVEGPEDALFSCNAYFDATGAPLVTFVARKLRQWPPHVGTSASGEECRNDEVLKETLRVFGSVPYQGLAYLEMKRDSRTGTMMIIEPNVGRPTGRSAIAEGGGVELVYTAYCDAAGLPLPTRRTQQYLDTTWLDVRRDVQAAVVGIRRGELTARDWLSSLRGPRTHAIWSARDPQPFATDLANVAGTALRRRR